MASSDRSPTAGLALRSILWTILFPGVVAGYVPWRFFGLDTVRPDWSSPRDLLAMVVLVAGLVLLTVCVLEFARSGRGTLAPMDPPKELVIQGAYRYVRNPMYLGVATILVGEVMLERSRALLAYAAIWFFVVNLFVIGYEEPSLRRRFGDSYRRYTETVGRWLPSRPKARAIGTVDAEKRIS
jgi:protein-S-isoprenylcysteine O-methyltransferase Ste14